MFNNKYQRKNLKQSIFHFFTVQREKLWRGYGKLASVLLYW